MDKWISFTACNASRALQYITAGVEQHYSNSKLELKIFLTFPVPIKRETIRGDLWHGNSRSTKKEIDAKNASLRAKRRLTL